MYLDLPIEIERLDSKRHSEQRMLDELMRIQPSKERIEDVVIDLTSGKPVEKKESSDEEDILITKPFRPQRRTHLFNRRNVGRLRSIRGGRGHGRSLGIEKTPTLLRPKSLRMMRHQNGEPMVFKVNKIPNPPPMPPKPELKKPSIRPPTPLPYKDSAAVSEETEDRSNLVDKIFEEFEKGKLDTSNFLSTFQNSEIFKGLVKDTSLTADKFLSQVQETTNEMVDRLFNNIIDGEDQKDAEKKKSLDDEMNKDWIKFNQEIFDITKPYMPAPQAANSYSGFASFKPLEMIDQSLLNNEDDQKVQKECNQAKNNSCKLANRVSDKKQLKKMVDNFEETSDQIISPKFMIEQLNKAKSRILLSPNQKLIELTSVCVNQFLVNKIRSKYYERYPDQNNVDSLLSMSVKYQVVKKMDSGRLLAIVDEMINKYRCLADDRKILDHAADIGEEIADVVDEHTEIQNKLAKLEKFNQKLDLVRQTMMELSQMSFDLDLYDGYEEIDNQLMNNLRCFQSGIQETRVNELISQGEKVQAKFNYYQKMANELVSRVQVITKMPASNLETYQLFPQQNMWDPFQKPFKVKVEDISSDSGYTPACEIYQKKKVEPLDCCFSSGFYPACEINPKMQNNCQLRPDPTFNRNPWSSDECTDHFYPFDLTKKTQ